MHHAPSTGDLPSTTFTSAHGGVRIEPMNYFLSNPAKQTKQMVHVNMSTLNVTTFGAVPMNCSVKVPDVTEGWGRLGF
jgi:primary-amine oxidase